MGGFTSIPDTTSSKQNFYGFKYNPVTDTLTVEEFLWGNTEVIMLPQLNDDGTLYVEYDDTYYTNAVTTYELGFSWDNTNYDQLIMEVN